MTEDNNIAQQAARKAWVSPVVIEGSVELKTESVGAAATDIAQS